jgi:predicted ABC-type transport system involved in lysophospholipase L1 biosynthesis ATPase subunit
MRDVLYLAWRYLRFNRVKTVVLIGSISLILFLPAALQVTVRQTARTLTARADATPLLVDEPTGNLDPANRDQVIESLLGYGRAHDAPVVIVTHDHELLPRFDRTIDVSTMAGGILIRAQTADHADRRR